MRWTVMQLRRKFSRRSSRLGLAGALDRDFDPNEPCTYYYPVQRPVYWLL